MAWLLLSIGCMAMIYHTSGTPYQQQDIKPALEKHISLDVAHLPHIHFTYDGESVSTEQPYVFTEFILRKTGHVTEYTVLTFLMIMAIRFSKIPLIVRTSASCAAAFLFGCSDEWHQTFIPKRTGHFIDVYTFDLAGIVLGAIFYSLLHLVAQKRDFSLESQKEEEPGEI
jgi:VanZ family protein